jgi:tetratricopeptide (TPR) repeat protein
MSKVIRECLILVLVVAAIGVGCARSPEAKKARYLDRGDQFFAREQYREAIIEYRNVRRIDADNHRAVRQLGLAHFQLGEMGQAFDYLQKARELDPDDRDVRIKLGTIYLLARHPKEAQEETAFILERDPKNLEALLVSSAAADTLERVDAAIRRLEEVRSLFGDRAKLYVGLGTLYLRKRDVVQAEGAFKEAVAREPKSLDAHEALGDFLTMKRDFAQAEQEYTTAAAIAPPGSRPRLKLADFYLTQQKPADARRVLTEMTAKAPDYLPAWRRLAEMAFNEGKYDESLKFLAAVFKKSPSDVDGHVLSGRVHLAKRETTRAIEEFQTALKLEPRLTQARYFLALTQLQVGNFQQARADLKEAAADPKFIDAALLLAELDAQSGALQPAIEVLEKVLARDPANVRAHLQLGTVYLKRNEPVKAGEVFQNVVTVAPKDPRGPYFVGLALWRQGKRPEARRQMETAMAMAPPDFVEPLVELVAMAFAERAPDEAVARVQAQITRSPTSAALYRVLGSVHVRRNESDGAEAAFLKSIELDPNVVSPYLALADLYTSSGKYDPALEKVNRGLQADPKSLTGHMLAGLIYERKGDIPKARAAYESALALKPRFGPAANNLAYLHSIYGGDKEKALELAQLAKEVAPDEPHVSDTLGWVLYRRGVYHRALALLKESAAKLPDNPEVQYHLGMIEYKLGSREAAKEALSRAMKPGTRFPGFEDAKTTLAAL